MYKTIMIGIIIFLKTDNSFGLGIDEKHRLVDPSCNEMCWLCLFELAEDFHVLGTYEIGLRWRAGERFEDAEIY